MDVIPLKKYAGETRAARKRRVRLATPQPAWKKGILLSKERGPTCEARFFLPHKGWGSVSGSSRRPAGTRRFGPSKPALWGEKKTLRISDAGRGSIGTIVIRKSQLVTVASAVGPIVEYSLGRHPRVSLFREFKIRKDVRGRGAFGPRLRRTCARGQRPHVTVSTWLLYCRCILTHRGGAFGRGRSLRELGTTYAYTRSRGFSTPLSIVANSDMRLET